MNVKIFRDIDELKIWGNKHGFRLLRDPDDKTKYKVCLTDADVDKLETFVRSQQAEIEALKAKMSLNSYDDSKNVAYQLFREKISLRNYFAAKAMQGLIAGCYSGNNSGFTVEGNVFAAYEYADEMMKVGKSD